MNEEVEKTILRRLSNLETHIINLIHPIQAIGEVLKNSERLDQLVQTLNSPLKIEDKGLRFIIDDIKVLLKQNKEFIEKLDVVQSLGEIKFIGKKLHQIEADIAEIKNEGIKKKVELQFFCDGYEMVRIQPEKPPLRKMVKKEPISLDELFNLMNLTLIQRNILINRLGLLGHMRKTFTALAKTYNISATWCSLTYKKVIRKLRHPSWKGTVKATEDETLIKEVLGEE